MNAKMVIFLRFSKELLHAHNVIGNVKLVVTRLISARPVSKIPIEMDLHANVKLNIWIFKKMFVLLAQIIA